MCKNVWYMVHEYRGFNLIRAEKPCMKGEVVIGFLTIGWQS